MKLQVSITLDGFTRTLTRSGLIEFMKNNAELLLSVERAVTIDETKKKRGRQKKK